MNEVFEYRLIAIVGSNDSFDVTDSIVIGNNDEETRSVVNQIKMKFWKHKAHGDDEDVLMCVTPVRIVNGRESTAATFTIESYKKEVKDEIIDFVRSLASEKSALPK